MTARHTICVCGHLECLHVPGGGSCTAGCGCLAYDRIAAHPARVHSPAGGVNAAPRTSTAMDGHDDEGGRSTTFPAPAPSPSSAAGGTYVDAVRLAWPDDDAVRAYPESALEQIHELADRLANAELAHAQLHRELEMAAPYRHRARLAESQAEAEARQGARWLDALRFVETFCAAARGGLDVAAVEQRLRDAVPQDDEPSPEAEVRSMLCACGHTWSLHRAPGGCTTFITTVRGRDICACAVEPARPR